MYPERRTNQRLLYWGLGISLTLLLAGWWAGSASTLLIPGGRLIALSRLFGLLATYTILLEILLMCRTPFIEENFDLHETIDLHHWNGYGILLSIIAHTVFVVLGYAAPGHTGLWRQFVLLNTQYEDVLIATIGTIIFFIATFLSLKIARKKLPHELWFITHLTLYAAVILVTPHQLKTGGDFIGHFWYTTYWYMWYIGVFGALAYYRFLRPMSYAARYQFRIQQVVAEANNIYSVYVTGRNIDHFRFKSGQYATWWILAPGMWWQGHPFSFSGPPGEEFIRFTIKVSGDFTKQLARLQPGARIIVDGPRGSFTSDRAYGANRVLLIAGGIGVAPYLSTIEALLTSGKRVTLLYSARSRKDISFGHELTALREQGLRVQIFLQGRQIDEATLQPYAQPGTVVYLCGPDGMSHALTRTLKRLGVSKAAIVTERFAY
jgi:predicted ferric reductase